jgi:anti-sigma B factor antagonist
VANTKLVIEDLVNLPDGPHILRLTGPLTLTTVPEIQSKMETDRSPNLILDCTHVPYVDSIGMGTLVDVNIRHRRDGNSVSLVGASDRVRSVLKLARVDRFFRFFDSLNKPD